VQRRRLHVEHDLDGVPLVGDVLEERVVDTGNAVPLARIAVNGDQTFGGRAVARRESEYALEEAAQRLVAEFGGSG